MTGLEALENIKRDMEYVTRLDFVKPIVRGEVQQELYKIYHRETPELDTIEQELKALEIIKEKKVDCGYLTYLIEIDRKNALRLYNQEVEINPYGYFDELLYDCRLTQEEYDLLKEVLK